jgi:hypothetical protein
MSIQFQSLFTIQLTHDYYDKHEKRCTDFDILPAEDCALLMKNMRILYRNYNNRLLTVVEAVKEVNDMPPPAFKLSPLLNFTTGMVFRYYLVLKNPHFSNFTAIALPLSDRKRLYFSNLSNNTVGSTLSLSNTIGAFVINKVYAPGDMVKGTDNNFYEAIRASDGTPASKDLANTAYWQQATANNPYVSNNDQVIVAGDYYNYRLQVPSGHITIKIFSLNKSDNSLPYDNLVETIEKTYSQNQETVTIDFSKKTPGKYRVVVNTEEDAWIYVDPAAIGQNVFGIIEIHHFEKVPPSFQLLAPGGRVRIPEALFTIQFKNRSVIWKYISQNDAISVADSGVPAQNFIPAAGTMVKSEKAIGLTEKPISTLTATRTATGKQIKNLKNPDIEKLVFEQDGNTGFFAGNMYVKIDI